MGFSVIVSKHVKDTKNDCACKPTHAQVQQETRHGVSCSHCEAQRQDLLCSRSYLSPSLNHDVSPAQPPQLRCCLLGGDSRGRDSLRLDRGSSGEASIHQVGAQDDPSDRISTLDQLGNIRAGQGSRCQIRCRVGPHYRSRNFKSCPGLGQLFSDQVHPDLDKSHNLKIHKLTSHGRVGPQASSFKLQATSVPTFR